MACTEGDGRPDITADEGERSSGVVATAAPLADCGHLAATTYRGLCRSCYRKLGEADALPPPREQGRPRVHPLRRWLGTLDTALLIQLKAWIEEVLR